MLEDLKELGALVHNSTTMHSYPHCWRCDTKLIYIATEQWFINIQKVKSKLISENRKVSWHPKEAVKWQEDVLQSSPDWTVSRQRYWGIPMPVWECAACKHRFVAGSVKELRELAVNKDYVDSLTDIHRPYVDNIIIKCAKCGAEMRRIKDILDVWFDSSLAFRASLTDEEFERLFPMDFILEAVEQLRAWFSYQLKTSVLVHGKKPFKNVVTHGMMLGSDGREMHKKTGNYVPLNDILKTVTADSFRLWCTSHTPQLDLIFSMEKINEANRTVMLLYNISNLIQEYSDAVGYRPQKVRRPRLGKLGHEDAWIVSRLNSTMKAVTESLDNYETYKAVNSARSFITMDLSRFYLKTAKKRILYSSRKESKATLDLLNYLFFNTLIMFAPITPFAAEKVYLDRYKFAESIFLESWPKYGEKLIDTGMESEFEVALDSITAILNSREKANVKLRWPLAKATVEASSDESLRTLEKLSHMVEDYTNIKKLVVKRAGRSNAEIKPNFAKIGPDFKANATIVADAIKSASPLELEDAVAKSGGVPASHREGNLHDKPESFHHHGEVREGERDLIQVRDGLR